ncbi:MAG TPA: PTS sugar transporter subunit IIA [Phycisphaerales bacterium]|nr:PTS sugar transporter subunit IIA [Phycisphaerales bacterium]
MKLNELVPEGAITTNLHSTQRDDVIGEMVDLLIASGAVQPGGRDELIKKILDREQKGSTGFGRGVAVPHVKLAAVTRMAVAIGLSKTGIDFNALDHQPVYTIFLLLSPIDRPEEHLQAMVAIFNQLGKQSFRHQLRLAETVEDVRALLSEVDSQQVVG